MDVGRSLSYSSSSPSDDEDDSNARVISPAEVSNGEFVDSLNGKCSSSSENTNTPSVFSDGISSHPKIIKERAFSEMTHCDETPLKNLSVMDRKEMFMTATDSLSVEGTPSDREKWPKPKCSVPRDSHQFASNTIVATNGFVYQFEPFQLPPPQEIAELFNEKIRKNTRKQRTLSDMSGMNSQSSLSGTEEKKDFIYNNSNESVLRKRRTADAHYNDNNHDQSTDRHNHNNNLKKVSIRSPSFISNSPKYELDKSDTDENNNNTNNEEEQFIFNDFNIKTYLLADIFGSCEPGIEETTADKVIKKFISVPIVLEKMLFFGQTLIKLYVMTAMLEIFDKLLCSFGQDAFASLYLQTRLATVTVALNSADQAFLTLIVLNNFAEIKSFVFKKFDKQNLFQLSCADVTERFQTVLFISLIISVSIAQSDSPWREVLPSYIYIVFLMLCGEAVADWVKHCFITKFNSIEARAYDDYARILRNDILSCHRSIGHNLDPTYTVTRRVGLAQIPLACVFVRYIVLVIITPWCWTEINAISSKRLFLYFITGFSILVAFKVLLGVGLIFYSGYVKNLDIAARMKDRSMDFKRQLQRKKSIGRLANIERYTIIKGRIQG
eukprot:gene6094-12310_t